ncbi:MAG: hypothetical protein JWP06_1020 [Candidatus Saccharibacteria bacterium]|nr:hypothetical protein [Candidatus Saccharibacteria bacterium]
MKSINKFFDFKRAGYIASVFAMLLATALPSLAFADQATDRSIALSNSSVSATDTTYTVNFKSVAAAGAFVVDFCSNSPAISTACTPPTGFDLTTPTSATSGFTTVAALTSNTLRVTGTIAAATAISVDVAHITNPSTAGPLYARIVTYTNATDANGYTSVNPDVVGPHIDNGGVAMSITPTIGVSGAVLETLIFCASNHVLTSNCGGADAPNVVLGTNGILGNVASEGTIHSQISTNAVSGAIVNLKSSAAGCGGLLRAGTGTAAARCGIKPILTAGPLTDGASLFGVRLTGLANGTGTVARSGNYDGTNFLMNYDGTTEATGVTSTYGDPIYNTASAPISNGGVDLVFGANIGNDTPAGAYSANLSLIATGKF